MTPRPDTPPAALPLPAAVALVAAGGTLGVLARALLAQAVPTPSGAWPWTTSTINVAGSFALGALLAALPRGTETARGRAVRLGAGTGVLGGFTTYSTFALEVEQLLTGGHAVLGVAYALTAVVLGVVAALGGMLLVGRSGGRGRGAPVRGAPGGPS